MEKNKIVENFGKKLIQIVWDNTIVQMDMIFNGKMKSKDAQILNKKIIKLNEEGKLLLKEITMETIRRNIFNLLNFFEEEEKYFIGFNDKKTMVDIKEVSDGLAGELYGETGWIKKYNKKKI